MMESWTIGGSNMEIEMRLAHLEGEIISSNEISKSDFNPREFKVLGLEFFLEEDMEPEEAIFFRGKDDVDQNIPFITKTHFRNKNKDFCIPVFHLTIEPDEKESDFSLRFGLSNVYDEQHEMYCYNGYFFDLPRGKYKKENGQYVFEYSSKPEELTLGISQVGTSNIYVYKNNREVESIHKLIVLPSTMTYQDVEKMIKEISSISRELVSMPYEEQIKQKVYTGSQCVDIAKLDSFDIYLQYLNMRLDNFAETFKKICKKPYEELESFSEKCSLNKIPKINNKIIFQYIKNPARKKYKTNIKRKSFNIYEHRLIKYRLCQLREYLDNQSAYNHDLHKEQYDMAEKNISDLLNKKGINDMPSYGEDLLSQLQRKRDEIYQKIKKQKTNIISTMKLASKHAIPNIPNSHLKIKIVQSKPPEIKRTTDKISFVFKPEWAGNNHSGWKSIGISMHFISEIEIELNCPSETYNILRVLLNSFLNNQERKDINIEFNGVFKWDNPRKLVIYRVYDLIVDNNKKNITLSDEEIYIRLCNFYIDFINGESKVYEEDRFYLGAIQEYEEQYQHNKNGIGVNAKKLLKNLYNKIDRLLALPMIVDVPNRKENAHLTQIFTNDYNYHKVYKILEEMDTFLDFSFTGDKDKLVLKKLDRIYEYWILTKILQKLVITYHWLPTSGDDFRMFMHSLFYDISENEKNNRVEHTGYPIIRLYRKAYSSNGNTGSSMHLDLYYDTKIKESLFDNCIINDIMINGAKKDIINALNLSPDFLFRIKKGQSEHLFIMDAKCKNYAEMGVNSWLDGDLLGVAAYKYIYRLHKFLKKDISAAFIVHPDISQYIGNPNRYLGKYVTYDAYGDRRFSRKLEGCDFFQYPLKEIELGDNDKQRNSLIGSYYLRPYTAKNNNSSLNLTLYFQEIFEYFMEDWEECWNCGSHSITRETHYTRSGYKKYYYYCNDCHAFWVKTHCDTCHKTIIKHYKNYFIETKHNAWHVQCPHCSPFLRKKDESYEDNLEPYYPF